MFVDDADTWRALGGANEAAELRPAAPADRSVDAFAVRLAVACGLAGRLWRVPPGSWRGGPDADAGTLVVCRGGAVSPYAALRDLTAAGEPLPGPVACLTLAGTSLQGQHGRRWQALPGNLHLSLALPCDLDAAVCAPSLPMLPAVALCEAVAELVGADAARAAGLGIKWVNDVVLDSRKLGGVLTTARTQGARVTTVFAGVGLNLARAPELPPDPFALPAVALAELGPAVPLSAATGAVLRRVQAWLAILAARGPGDLVAAYRERSIVLGREVAVWPAAARGAAEAAGSHADLSPAALPAPWRRGRVVTVEADLTLRLAGQAEPVAEGCLRLLEAPAGGPPVVLPAAP